MCADLTNAAFIISHLGKEFIIQAGNGDWEFFFSEDAKDVVHGRCVRFPNSFQAVKTAIPISETFCLGGHSHQIPTFVDH